MRQTGKEIYACGNNAWRQLEIHPEGRTSSLVNEHDVLQDMVEEPEDFRQFRKVLSVEAEDELLGVWAGLSWTVGTHLILLFRQLLSMFLF